ncbi:MAG: DNRLRE domain-containing protein [Nitrospiraceae bacterium]|nr:MAG: DNRLRE domain-containing protein [Nitrospiraceae bacterium]
MRTFVLAILILCTLAFMPAYSQAETAYIEAGGDNTLIENPNGTLSNGSGTEIYIGRTNQQMNSIRRGVIYFDISSALPADAFIESASLTLYMTKANNVSGMIMMNRLLQDWGEGASISIGGKGVQAQSGDATWVHTFYPNSEWSKEGGQYKGRISSSMSVGNAIGYYTFESTDRMIRDIDYWLRHAEKNFGWILIGDESNPQTVVPFASRENINPDWRPLLEITYSVPVK